MRKVIVDGYNLLHRVPETAGLARGDFEGAKRLLCRRLEEFAERSDARVTVVFDGYAGTSGDMPRLPRVKTVHTTAPETADQRIVKMVRRDEDPRLICVVTDDYKDIGGPARSLGAKVATSTEFAGSLSRKTTGRKLLQEKPTAPTTKEELEDWLKFFGDTDE